MTGAHHSSLRPEFIEWPAQPPLRFRLDPLLNELRAAIKTFPDRRTGKNLTYSIEDLGLGAFSVFFTQSPSFLSHQMAMEKTIGKSNAHTIFGMRNIPTDNHIRKQLDPVSPDFLNPVFASVLNALDTQGHLTSYRSVNHTLLIALDGTQYFKSNTINCEQCNCKKHKNGKTTYFHTVVTPVIVARKIKRVSTRARVCGSSRWLRQTRL